jgi:hypothetical protein
MHICLLAYRPTFNMATLIKMRDLRIVTPVLDMTIYALA